MNLVVFFVVIIVVVMTGIFGMKKEQAKKTNQKEREELKKRTLPNGGLIPEDNELLDATDEEILEIVNDNPENRNCPNLMYVINYVAYKGIEAPEEMKSLWQDLFDRLTKMKIEVYRHYW